MTARKTWPRSQAQHEQTTAEILYHYATAAYWQPSLPVPVHDIIENPALFGLTLLCHPVDEPPGEIILGALAPAAKTICLNERHMDIFDQWVGPEEFTYAHELGHWVYDAVDPSQGELFQPAAETVFCRRTKGSGDEPPDIREINANKFASCLLLPPELLNAAVTAPFTSWAQFAAAASAWHVSKATLRIRLETLAMEWAIP